MCGPLCVKLFFVNLLPSPVVYFNDVYLHALSNTCRTVKKEKKNLPGMLYPPNIITNFIPPVRLEVIWITFVISMDVLLKDWLLINTFSPMTFKKVVILEVVMMGAMSLDLWPDVKCINI